MIPDYVFGHVTTRDGDSARMVLEAKYSHGTDMLLNDAFD